MHWIASLTPLYDPDGLIEAVWDENGWVREALPNVWPAVPVARRRVGGKVGRFTMRDARSGLFESFARGMQLLRLPPKLAGIMNLDTRVVVTDNVLKFHENDRRVEIAARYAQRCSTVCV